MLLNCLSQPTILSASRGYLRFDDFKEAPLLLCNKNNLNGKLLPKGWCGKMLGTHEVLHEVEQKEYTITPRSTQVLAPNEIYTVNVNNNEKYQYNSKNIEITAIPWDKGNTIYLIKDDNVVNLLTDVITKDMTVFVQNQILRNTIKSGIDILYVNDGVYHTSGMDLIDFPSECLLGALVTLVQPRFVKGLLNDESLPQHIVNCCMSICNQ